MARSDDPEREIWGTWEELLLACAVGRHGTRRWESVAMEIQSRSPLRHLLTPQSCRQRYRDLQRRFSAADAGEDTDSTPEVPWLEELRRLRVAELRREVERYDLSIGSLESKVRKLQEERERSIRESNSGGEKPDRAKEDSRPSEAEPEVVVGDRVSGRDSGPSCEESTSIGLKKDDRKPSETEGIGGKPAEPAFLAAAGGSGEKTLPGAREGSCDGSTEGGAASDPTSQPQSGESVAESSKGETDDGEEQHKEEDDDGGNEGEKESSDVQSSASLSRQRQQRGRRWRKAVSGGSSSVGDEPEGDAEAEEVSALSNRHRHAAAESRPLVSFLEIVRSDKHGSVFDRRLDSQEGEEYRSLIRQHVDLEMVQSRIDRTGSGRPYAAAEFFRDLLLLCNNALVFYPKDAPEFVASLHLRALVSKRMTATLPTPTLLTAEAAPTLTLEPKPTASKLKLQLDLPVSLLGKSASPTPLNVCRKRSAISNKASAATSLKEEEIVEEEEKDEPEPEKKCKDNEDKLQAKKTAMEKPVLSGTTRGLRTTKTRGGHGGGGGAAGKRPGVGPTMNLKSKPMDVEEAAEASKKTDKKSVTPAAPTTKKQNAASFLNRLKKSSNGSTTTMMASDTVKNSSGGGSGKGSNQKKGGKGDNRKDKSSSQGGAGSSKKSEEMSGGKRSVGRPPKRSAPPLTPPPSKRAREETEPVAASSRPPTSASRKRGRK